MCLRSVLVGVEQEPTIFVKIADATERAMVGDCFPPLVPDAPATEHFIVLRDPLGFCLWLIEGITHRRPHQRRLLDAVHGFRHLHATAIENGWNDVGDVMILVANRDANFAPLCALSTQ